jgi:hypothetical protein
MPNTPIIIRIGSHQLNAELFDTATGKAIEKALPLETQLTSWGDELYFRVNAQAALEKGARETVAVGDLAYWPTMPAFCIFFGPTPVSIGSEPRAASPVNVFGKLIDPDVELLRNFRDGETVVVTLADEQSQLKS